LRESDEEKARLIAEEIATLKFPRLNFSEVKKGDECKIKIAVRPVARPLCPALDCGGTQDGQHSCGKGEQSGTDPFIYALLYDEHLAGAPSLSSNALGI